MSDQRPTVIGIAGKAGAGKDTFAQFLWEEIEAMTGKQLGISKLVKFADPLKEIVGILTGDRGDTQESKKERLQGWELRDYTPAVINPTRRELLQWLGTDVIRLVNANAWIECYARELQGFEPTDVVFTTDVRFRNELEYIVDGMERGHLVRVVRPGAEGAGDHASETTIDHIPLDTVLNDGTLDALRAKARAYAFYLTELYGWKR